MNQQELTSLVNRVVDTVSASLPKGSTVTIGVMTADGAYDIRYSGNRIAILGLARRMENVLCDDLGTSKMDTASSEN